MIDGEGDAGGLMAEAGYRNDGGSNFKVVIRVRPPLERELEGTKHYQNTVLVDPTNRVLTVSENLAAFSYSPSGAVPSDALIYATHQFTFDHVYDQDSEQRTVYELSAKSAVLSTLQGYNATIIAYGQTGTGKTYTMEGGQGESDRGIIPRAIEDIFAYIENDSTTSSKYLVRAAYLQIYNEVISDLLKPERTNMHIREDRKRGVFVEGLSEWVVRSPSEIYGLMERGALQRATGSTKMNELSSRSHAVFLIIAENSTVHVLDDEEGSDPAEGTDISNAQGTVQSFKVGKLNLVDLAGSERVRITGATGQRLEESKKINQSLSALGNVIAALTDTKGRQHIPYRDSKLTRILEDSLGGNCKTTMMAMISPALEAFMESLSTLKFANRAKNIKNEARVNEDLDQKTLLRKYEWELKKLRQELDQRSKNLVDKRRLLELEDQKRRAEEDKLAAITELEARSREFMREKQEKLMLEERISKMQSQLLIGGHKVEDTAAFRTLLQQEHKRIRGEYERRLNDLERERQNVEEDKAQVDRYKQLLLKQRDIMIALTARLNERDEQILVLQEEVEAYDGHQRKIEDALDVKTAELIALRKAAMEHNAQSPIKNTVLLNALGAWGVSNEGDTPGETLGASSSMGRGSVDGRGDSKESMLQWYKAEYERLAAASRVDSSHSLELSRLQEQCANHAKERAALKTILESKVRVLVENIRRSMDELNLGGGGGAGGDDSKLVREVHALNKLVDATVNAMHTVKGD